MKSKVKVFSLLKVLAALFTAVLIMLSMFMFAACDVDRGTSQSNPSSSTVNSGDVDTKTAFTFKLIKGGQTKEWNLKTDKKYLADALVEAGIIKYADDGYYTTFDGITADWNTDMSWWCVTVNGEFSMLGINDIEIKNGASYEVTYTIG